MANYVVSRYTTGIFDEYDDAAAALEDHLEYLDSTNHPVIGMGVILTRHDQQQAIGWLLHQGWDILLVDEAAHVLIDDGPLTITTGP